jgi:peptidylprolyl isomerase
MSNKNLVILLVVVAVLFVVFGLYFASTKNTPNSNAAISQLPTKEPAPQAKTEQPQLNNSTTTKTTMDNPDKLQVQTVKEGSGPAAKAGDMVSVNYTGTLTNGTKFDSSYDRGQPITFKLGVGQVIAGWDQGVTGMKVGEKRHLVIPASLAYGSQAMGTIPSNSTLVFDVELMKIN